MKNRSSSVGLVRRGPFHTVLLIALTGLVCLLAAAAPAAAQFTVAEQKCYAIAATPGNGTTSIDVRLDYDLSITRGAECAQVYVEHWSFSAVTDHLEITADPAPGKEVGVRPRAGAPVASRFIARAELWDRLTFEPVATLQRTLHLTVQDGALRPDLTLQQIDAPSHAVAGEAFTVEAEVVNVGDATSTAHTVGELLVGADAASSQLCPPLAVGESCRLELSATVAEEGIRSYTVCIDRADALDEVDETNNCAGGTVDVGPADAVDLVADAILVSTTAPRVGQPTQVTAVTRNVGGATSGPSTVTLETPTGSFSLGCPALEPLASCSRTISWLPDRTGLRTLSQRVVYGGAEVDVLNNRLFRNVEVVPGPALPDFVVLAGDITVEPAAPRVGDLLTITYRMTNMGAPFDPAPGGYEPWMRGELLGEGGNGTVCRGPLGTGESCEHQLLIYALHDGPQTFQVRADWLRDVTELDEDNNRGYLHFVVDGATTQLSCEGTWTLVGTGGTTFTNSGAGSVLDGCTVFYGENVADGCWRTVGDGGLQATWHRRSGESCPSSVTVTEPQAPHQVWTFDVFIH